MAHEIGHNVGMAHDFSDAHKAAGCDGTGIMSYGNTPNQWSTCSKADFTAQYKARESTWCMPGKHSHRVTLLTMAKTELLYPKNAGAWVAIYFT